MDGFNEKKWFVYLGDHHEGPFSLEEIQGKMGEGQVTRSSYVWAEGMTDWKVITEVPAFESILNEKPNLSLSVQMPGQTQNFAEAVAPISFEAPKPETPIAAEPATFAPPVVEEPTISKTETMIIPEASKREPLEQAPTPTPAPAAAAPTPIPAGPSPAAEKPKRKLPSAAKWAVAAAIPVAAVGLYFVGAFEPLMESPAMKAGVQTLSDFTQPYMLKAVEKVPALGKWVSPIPVLEDVAPEEYEELKAAAMTAPEQGPKVAIALARAELLTPEFYIASNLPDGAEFEVYVRGVPETLLNHLEFSGQGKAVLQRRIAKSSPVKFPDGKPLPRGEYIVYVIESANQPEAVGAALANAPAPAAKIPADLPKGRRILVKRTYFLGGNKDATYTARLKEFHEKLRARATAELNELNQFTTFLEAQLSGSEQMFGKLRKGKLTKAQQKSWNEFHARWAKGEAQLNETYLKWTPEILEKEYFYGSLYRLLQQAGQSIGRLHAVHNAYFTGSPDKASFEIQLGSAASQAQADLAALKSKLAEAAKMAPTNEGMPRREGL